MPETGCQWAGFLFTMKAGTSGLHMVSIPHRLENIGCTTPAGSNFWISGLSAAATKDPILIPWADGKTRWTRLFIGGVLGDQREGDKYTGEPCVCHRCFAPRDQYLSTADFEVKTMRKVSQRVEIAAAGGYMKGIRDKRSFH